MRLIFYKKGIRYLSLKDFSLLFAIHFLQSDDLCRVSEFQLKSNYFTLDWLMALSSFETSSVSDIIVFWYSDELYRISSRSTFLIVFLVIIIVYTILFLKV